MQISQRNPRRQERCLVHAERLESRLVLATLTPIADLLSSAGFETNYKTIPPDSNQVENVSSEANIEIKDGVNNITEQIQGASFTAHVPCTETPFTVECIDGARAIVSQQGLGSARIETSVKSISGAGGLISPGSMSVATSGEFEVTATESEDEDKSFNLFISARNSLLGPVTYSFSYDVSTDFAWSRPKTFSKTETGPSHDDFHWIFHEGFSNPWVIALGKVQVGDKIKFDYAADGISIPQGAGVSADFGLRLSLSAPPPPPDIIAVDQFSNPRSNQVPATHLTDSLAIDYRLQSDLNEFDLEFFTDDIGGNQVSLGKLPINLDSLTNNPMIQRVQRTPDLAIQPNQTALLQGRHRLVFEPPNALKTALVNPNVDRIYVIADPQKKLNELTTNNERNFSGFYQQAAGSRIVVRTGSDLDDTVTIAKNGDLFFAAGTGFSGQAAGSTASDVLVMTLDGGDVIDSNGTKPEILVGGIGDDRYLIRDEARSKKSINEEANADSDTIDLSKLTNRVEVDLSSSSTQQLKGAALSVEFSHSTSMESVIGTKEDDKLTGNARDNILEGGNGNDRYIFTDQNGGNTKIVEDDDLAKMYRDVLDFSKFPFGATVDLSRTGSQPLAGPTRPQLTIDLSSGEGIEDVIGSPHDDRFYANGRGNHFEGGSGDDTYGIGAPAKGGLQILEQPDQGNDTLDFETFPHPLVFDLAKTNQTIHESAGASPITVELRSSSNFVQMENVFGTNHDDRIVGNQFDNEIKGRSGNDVLIGERGEDKIDGGPDKDIILGDGFLVDGSVPQLKKFSDGLKSVFSGQLTLTGALVPLNGAKDILRGGDGDDFIVGGSGDDDIEAGLGNAIIFGDAFTTQSKSTINTSSYQSLLSTDLLTEGVTFLKTALKDLRLDDEKGNDKITGGDGINIILGGDGADEIHGGPGVDLLFGNKGGERPKNLDGTPDFSKDSTEIIRGHGGFNLIVGGQGDEELFGGNDKNVIIGDEIDISAFSINVDSLLQGKFTQGALPSLKFELTGNGADRLIGGDGSDLLVGGDGPDEIFAFGGELDIAFGDDIDVVPGGKAVGSILLDFFSLVGKVATAIAKPTPLEVLDAAIEIYEIVEEIIKFATAQPGEDKIFGGDGVDFIFGGGGNDHLEGEDGDDFLVGGGGNDTLVVATGAAGITDEDVATGGPGDDHFHGGPGNDILWSTTGQDVFHGGDGNDIIAGGEDRDELYGEGGNDSLFGQEGDDILDGGPGIDHLDGGPGADTYPNFDPDDLIVDRVTGDSNGDGIFNSNDLIHVFQIGKYEDDIPNNATFEEGDWNEDGDFNSRDFVFVFQAGTYSTDASRLDNSVAAAMEFHLFEQNNDDDNDHRANNGKFQAWQ